MYFLAVTNQNREQINTLIKDRWFTTEMVILGEIVDMTAVEGVAAMDGEEIVGLVTYRVRMESLRSPPWTACEKTWELAQQCWRK